MPETYVQLRISGWYPGRHVDIPVESQCLPTNAPGRAILEEFGDLPIGRPHFFVPRTSMCSVDLSLIWDKDSAFEGIYTCLRNVGLFQIGVVAGASEIFVDENGVIYLDEIDAVVPFAPRFERALDAWLAHDRILPKEICKSPRFTFLAGEPPSVVRSDCDK